MTTFLTPSPKQQFFTAAGVPLVGGKVYTYAAGTSTPLTTYQDSTGTVSNTNPIILDSRGECNLWLLPANAYKFILKDSTDALIWTVDNINLGINFSNVIITGGSLNGVTIGNITPGTAVFTDLTATGTVTFNGVTQMQIPAGPTANRSTTPVNGMIRYNSTTSIYEGNNSVAGQSISTLQLSGTVTAILTTTSPHGLVTGDYITVSGATPAAYNSSYNITYINSTSFSYTMASNPGGNATVVGSYIAHLWSAFGGSAAGSNTQVQYNNSGSLAGSSALTFNGTTLSTTNVSATTTVSASTLQGTTLSDGTNTTSATNAIKGSARAWVNWAGASGTINSSYNVSSVTRNSTGNYTVNFTSAFANTNYAIVYGGNRNNSATDSFGMNFYSQATGSVIVNTSVSTAGYTDATAACIACFA
jgi:hypothetical protein